MSPKCSALNRLQVALLGGIPALIYSTYANHEDSPKQRFRNAHISLDPNTMEKLLTQFVLEFIGGEQRSERSVQFDMFTTVPKPNRMRWPLCYAACIIKLFSSMLPYLEPLKKCFKNLQVFSSVTNSGKDWEVIIEIALLFRFYGYKLNRSNVPLGLLEGTQSEPEREVDVKYVSIPHEIKSLCINDEANQLNQDCAKDNVYEFIQKTVKAYHTPTLLLFSPVDNSFPVFDGFAVFTKLRVIDGVESRHTVISGYQAKKGKVTVTPTVGVPAWVNGGGWIVRGHDAICDSIAANGWIYLSETSICKDILGYSLTPIYPASVDW
jgi:hypothetical protein